ncbi:enoyl-CoA hydratase/isomerase family protein [Rhodococcus sp. IEGM 1307]|uniref:enoyl-CoA hydratase/isomerase family protein n=1 Tax=Rhodococcus sp. IEGM 1307 TaxID=3047091 RepID=UPI0024B638C0|nr:enoyl-CoA hydratase/isomerase family protein [Rhodococcus sp. IEGM 1307]MDI9979508.1 enoyl-CoA hydratase/isomerase family protein [Rhodococcus sp. IEGM 1307]
MWTQCQAPIRAPPGDVHRRRQRLRTGRQVDARATSASRQWPAESATIGVPEMALGAWRIQAGPAMPKQVLPKHAAEMVFLAQRIDAPTAHRFGLVNEVVPDGLLLDRACALATRIAGSTPWHPPGERRPTSGFRPSTGMTRRTTRSIPVPSSPPSRGRRLVTARTFFTAGHRAYGQDD